MSARALDNAVAAVREALAAVIWGQWSVLGGRAGGRVRQPRAVVDPEALMLVSCALRDAEPRLWDLVAGFAAESPGLLSVQRTRNLAKAYPPGVQAVLAEVAAVATSDGKDARWAPLAAKSHRAYRARKVAASSASFLDPAALAIRLRMAFGVHARTDVLVFLITSGNGGSTAKDIAQATGYGTMPVRRACELMARSRIVQAEDTRPERYRVRRGAWQELLELPGEPPRWRHWQPIFAFLAHALAWDAERGAKRQTAYLVSGDARRLVLDHRAAFSKNQIELRNPAAFPGEAFVDGFAGILGDVRRWLDKS